jgi:hypothetical protein
MDERKLGKDKIRVRELFEKEISKIDIPHFYSHNTSL